MSFIYPRTIRVLRPTVDRSLGATGYSGQRAANEECLAEDVPAAIQMKKESLRPGGDLPGDTARRTFWAILIPREALPAGTIRIRDIIEDDAKARYQVLAPYLTGMGYNLLAELLEV